MDESADHGRLSSRCGWIRADPYSEPCFLLEGKAIVPIWGESYGIREWAPSTWSWPLSVTVGTGREAMTAHSMDARAQILPT